MPVIVRVWGERVASLAESFVFSGFFLSIPLAVLRAGGNRADSVYSRSYGFRCIQSAAPSCAVMQGTAVLPSGNQAVLVVQQSQAHAPVKLTSICMQDISIRMLVYKNLDALREVLWKITRQFASSAAYTKVQSFEAAYGQKVW